MRLHGRSLLELTRQQVRLCIYYGHDTYAFLEAVDNGHVQYVKTTPDSTRADNLLSLPRF